MKLLVTRELFPESERQLREAFSSVEIYSGDGPMPERLLRERLAEAEALLCTISDKVCEETLSFAPRLRHVVTFSVGLDHLDLPALKRRSISVSHTPAVLTDATADLTFALLLAVARNLFPARQLMDAGAFVGFGPKMFLGLELRGARLGIVGMGKIGQAVAERALGFGMRVSYCGSEKSLGFSAEHLTLDELLSSSQVVSLHCPLTSSTHHLIGKRELGLMARDGILINTARGAVVDEAALIEFCRNNPEFRVGTDVFEFEPEVPRELLGLPNIVALPHIGSATWNARGRMAQVCVEEAVRFAKGETLQHAFRGN